MKKFRDIEIPLILKWAGGKFQLLKQLEQLFPSKFKNYFEPFVGGGAVFYYVAQKYRPKKMFISDINTNLITMYRTLQKDPKKLVELLRVHKQNHNKEYYYKIRSVEESELTKLELVARLIYLNRTCFNGLYRVNSKGKFNVPIGSYKKPSIVQEDKIKLASKILKKVKITNQDFESIIKKVNKDDFVYFDPPYYPLNETSFTKYSKNDFLEKDHIRLQEVFNKLHKKGCRCLQSNSYTEFIEKKYNKFKQFKLNARRSINSNSEGRGKIKELAILNYEGQQQFLSL